MDLVARTFAQKRRRLHVRAADAIPQRRVLAVVVRVVDCVCQPAGAGFLWLVVTERVTRRGRLTVVVCVMRGPVDDEPGPLLQVREALRVGRPHVNADGPVVPGSEKMLVGG